MSITENTTTTRLPMAGVDFEAKLESLVHHHIGALTASHAVDEANGDVLDALIDGAVATHQETIDAQAILRRETLRRQLSDLQSAIVAASRAEDEALERAEALTARVLSLRSLMDRSQESSAGGPGPASVFEVHRLQHYSAQRRQVLERDAAAARRGARVRSGSRLMVVREAAARRAESAARAVTVRTERHDLAVAELDRTLARFRGRPAQSTAISTPVGEVTDGAA